MTRIPNAHRLGWHVATVTRSTESVLYVPEKPSRWKRWLPVWLVPLLGLIALSWDWARLIERWMS